MNNIVRKFIGIPLLIMALIIPFASAGGAAPQYTYKTIDYPLAYSTSVIGINAKGDVVGQFTWEVAYAYGKPNFHGFLLSNNEWTVLDFPDAISTTPQGIGPSGDVVGYYVDASFRYRGFLRTKEGQYSTVDYPAHSNVQLAGIGPDGSLYGVAWNTMSGASMVDAHSIIILANGEPVRAAEHAFTGFTRATPNGKILAGFYRNASGIPPIAPPPNKACAVEDGIVVPLTLTGLDAVYSAAWGISPSGNTIVGIYGSDLAHANTWYGHAFIGERRGKGEAWQFTDFSLPNPAIVATRIFDINAGGTLVGAYNYAYDGTNAASYAWHGFIATPVAGKLNR